MKKDNITCIQRAQFVLHFYEGGEWRKKEESPYDRFIKKQQVTPDDLKALADYTTARMNRTQALFAFLLEIHDDWIITPKREGIILETETMDFEAIIPLLIEKGFTEEDYILYSEYTRKWGML